MALQKVNTEAIASMATDIANANQKMNEAFSRVEIDGKNMDTRWNSKAGTQAATIMYNLFKGNEARSAVLENYVTFLQQFINPSYTAAEEQNTKLSDQFL